jgi:hypothetical protein
MDRDTRRELLIMAVSATGAIPLVTFVAVMLALGH